MKPSSKAQCVTRTDVEKVKGLSHAQTSQSPAWTLLIPQGAKDPATLRPPSEFLQEPKHVPLGATLLSGDLCHHTALCTIDTCLFDSISLYPGCQMETQYRVVDSACWVTERSHLNTCFVNHTANVRQNQWCLSSCLGIYGVMWLVQVAKHVCHP